MHALGAALGQHITHLTFTKLVYIRDDVWPGLWAAFPHLRFLSLDALRPGSSASVLRFCAAAPHALELHLGAMCNRAVASHLEQHLDSTRVMVFTSTLQQS
jgi:hypothetical protein